MFLSAGGGGYDAAAVVLRTLVVAPQAQAGSLSRTLDDGLPRFQVVASADTESQAIQLYLKLLPDLVVIDWRIARHEPARLVGILRRVAPDARIIFIAPAHTSMPARAVLALGVEQVVTEAEVGGALERLAARTIP